MTEIRNHSSAAEANPPVIHAVSERLATTCACGRLVKVLEPLAFDAEAWRAKLDSYGDIAFMEDGREQPPMPPGGDIIFD